VFRIAKACLLLGTFLAGSAFPAWAQSNHNQQVIVSVYDDVGVSATTLEQTEEKANRIFEKAGLNLVWQNCNSPNHAGPDALVRAGEQSSPDSVDIKTAGLRPTGRVGTPAPTWVGSECGRFEWPTSLAVRIVSGSGNLPGEVFGAAFLSADGSGCYSDVFYDRATALQATSNVGLSDILGSVVAHELGHLLLGSNAHTASGIMRAQWKEEELNRIVRGNLLFSAAQSERMRARLLSTGTAVAIAARMSR
jgi:hypothetical protein